MHTSLNHSDRVGLALFVLRIGVLLVMGVWTLDKFVRPEHAASVHEHFYALGGLGPALMYTPPRPNRSCWPGSCWGPLPA